jgi:tetratricopeptide (TPR) repeat protein
MRFMKRRSLILLGSAAAVAVAGAFFLMRGDASAQRCFAGQGEVAVAACTVAIHSGRFSGPALAAIYDNRAIELRQQGDYDLAVADYSEAIRHDAALIGAYTGRGLAYEGLSEIEKAKTDYRAALALGPKYADGEWAQETARGRLAALAAD